MKHIIFFTSFFLSLFSITTAFAQTWTNESELGIVSSQGNTTASSYLLKQTTSSTQDKLTEKIKGNYFKNTATDNTTGTETNFERWDAMVRLDYQLSDPLGIFVAQGAESDKASGIYRRYNSDVGSKYYFLKREDAYLLGELGYRYTHEEYTESGSDEFNFIRAYLETEKKWTPTFSTKLWVEYLPNLDRGTDYHVNGEASVNAAINNVFSIKTAYLAKYTNEPPPPAIHRTDSLFSTSLIAKF
jgi:putative salt-induced outer membrane protein